MRRAALRSVRLAATTSAARGVRAGARQAAAVTLLPQNAWAPVRSAAFSSISTDHVEVEDDEDLAQVVLEPLPARSGFADQKELDDFNFSEKLRQNLEAAGITHLFPVQAQSFDVMMQGSDIVGRSKTGSGKTLAFGLPIVETLLTEKRPPKDPRALILLPTRELAIQVAEEIKRIASPLRIVNVVGGVSYVTQENHLRRGADILVGTPGRIQDLVNKGSLSLDHVQISVLDEADMMLKFGFQEAVESILGCVPGDRQCVMWSATFPKWVNTMAKKFTRDAVSIDLVGDEETHVPATVAHKAIHAPLRSRIQVLENVLRHQARGGQTLIFTETKQEADEIANALTGQSVRALHGDLSQGMRSSTMDGFRNGSIKTLVCTDIAARGLDIANVELVVQYRLPHDKESFVHRAGRTGRAGRSGTNVVFFDRQDAGDVRDFEKRYKFNFKHAAPPLIEHVLDGAVHDAAKRLDDVPSESVALFNAAAQRMLDERGVDALSSALALLCGFDNEHLSAYSMLTGRSKTQTVEVSGAAHARELQELLSAFDSQLSRRDIHSVDDKFVFDIPHHSVERLREHLVANGADHITISPVIELSRVLVNNQNGSPKDGNSFGDRRNGRFGDRRGDGNGSRGRRGNNDRSRSFDSSFSRGRDRDNNRDGHRGGGNGGRRGSSSVFGRFSEPGRSSRSNQRGNSSGGFRDSW
ncbi:hypothetical protein Poli38472_014810 [Pythium oligandrum]|uniref:RNA helicase n=1 Tax=Pythium oligandrum TaxID=41045 RepID=A0A8K1FHH1_PYTOL|nr:hypothetical protein Poli38472_014810 [Pythium oligandrum]|eukprot:TMW63900.1 hypothetical protein Poli38472_014810 [Pythium oligandrum]